MADLLQAVASGKTSSNDQQDHGKAVGISNAQAELLKEHAVSWAAAHGLLVGAKDGNASATFTHIPFCLLPVQLSKAQFERGVELSPLYGRLMDRVSRDLDWLHSTVESVVAEDKFTGRLLELSKKVAEEGIQQKAYLGIHRSDYMLHDPPKDVSSNQEQRLLQVELNTISASFASISSKVTDLHKYLINRLGTEIPDLSSNYGISATDLGGCLPSNDAIINLPKGFAAAHHHYNNPSAIILMVVQPNEANSIDQRWIEYNLWDHHHIRVLRRTLTEIHAMAALKNVDGKRKLFIDGKEVSVVYFRSGYTPEDHPTEVEWEARELLERSYAIKCPSVAYHLAGTKKVQQTLADPSVLRRFISNEEDAKTIEASFAGLYGLEQKSVETEKIKQMAVSNPKGYVLKPQREGGGNNLYGQEVSKAMQDMSPSELESYILMERIFPKEMSAVLVRSNTMASGPTISELGMFITTLFDDGEEVMNAHAGHLLRTKLSEVDEGGVATGFSVISSPLLV